MHENEPYYLHCASKCTVCIVPIMCLKLKSIKSTLGERGGSVAARWSAAELSQRRTRELSTKDTCHLESHWVEKCTAAGQQRFWLRPGTTLRRRQAGEGLEVGTHGDRFVKEGLGKWETFTVFVIVAKVLSVSPDSTEETFLFPHRVS